MIEYKCVKCGADNCKLWRESYVNNVELHCAVCAAKAEKKDISDIDENGKRTTEYGRTDQIGTFIPAVPTEDQMSFWGYNSVPDKGCRWWRALPTLGVKWLWDRKTSLGETGWHQDVLKNFLEEE